MKKCFLGADIVDVKNGKTIKGVNILAEQGIIVNVGKFEPPKDATVFDFTGRVMLPGLFNVHTHILFDSTPNGAVIEGSESRFALAGINNMRKYIDSGVTFIRDMGGAKHVDLEIRDLWKEKKVVGPEIVVSGKNISITGGQSWQNGIEADGAAQCQKAVREECKAGVDWVKMMASGGSKTPRVSPYDPQFSLEEMQMIVVEAQRQGRKVAAHAMGGESAYCAALAGVASIEHGYALDERTLGVMVEKGISYVPTLAINDRIIANQGEFGVTDAMVEEAKRLSEKQSNSLRKAQKFGVRICVGTDACSPYNDHDGTGYELITLVHMGLSNAQAIQAATINAAALCGVAADLGSIEIGKRANFAVFKENPLEDMGAILHCDITLIDGKIIEK